MMSEQQRSALASTAPHLTDVEARAAARAIVNLFHLWSVSDTEARDLLGGLSSRTARERGLRGAVRAGNHPQRADVRPLAGAAIP